MACHTWFYRKLNITQQEAKENCLEYLKKSRNLAWKIYKNPTGYCGIDWDTTKDEQFKQISVLNRQIKAVSNNFYQCAVWNHQSHENLTYYVKGKGLYIEDTGFHDWFRRGGYPDDELFSLQETLDYINNPKNECTVYDNTIIQLEKFWKQYPDGLIIFG